jgi:predicted Zn-dependent protease
VPASSRTTFIAEPFVSNDPQGSDLERVSAMPGGPDRIGHLRSLCGGPRDGALLRFSLGNALLAAGHFADAATELRRAVDFDPNYSAAWKLLGRALVEAGDAALARQAWNQGMAAAQRVGDVQARKEMQVFLKRLDKSGGSAKRD